jgi:hypothetical protein
MPNQSWRRGVRVNKKTSPVRQNLCSREIASKKTYLGS